MRKRISERNIFPKFSIENEYNKLVELTKKPQYVGKGLFMFGRSVPNNSLMQCLNAWFYKWELRGTFTSLNEMMNELEIGQDYFASSPTKERLLDYLQFLVNAIAFTRDMVEQSNQQFFIADTGIESALLSNIMELCDFLGTEIVNEKNELFIVYKNDVASLIGEQFPKIKDSITDYNKIDIRGDLVAKAEILCTLAKELEPMEKTLCNTEFANLCKSTTMLFNKAGIRHASNDKCRIDKYFADLSDDEREKWYDVSFNLFIACMAVMPYIEVKEEINEIRRL